MKKLWISALPVSLAMLLSLAFAPARAADDPQARAIMEAVDARDDGDNQTSDMEMILIDKRGKQRERKIATFSKDKGQIVGSRCKIRVDLERSAVVLF